MTRTGYICMIVIMLVSAGGMIVCGLKNRDKPLRHSGTSPCRGGRELPTVTWEPVVFRSLEERYVSCRASVEVGAEQMEERGFDPRDKRHRAAAEAYYKKELAYILADQLLDAGAIRYELSGGVLRAKVRAAVEGGARDA